jgi:hypothetical protein
MDEEMNTVRRSERGSIPTAIVAENRQIADAAAAAAAVRKDKRQREEVESAARIIYGFNKQSPSGIGVPFLPSAQGVNPYEDRMGAIIKTVFPQEVLDAWQKPGRAIYEGSSPPTQCNNTIGPATKDTVCWLCGIKVNLAKTKVRNGMKPICEHVLPIAQAVFFLGLYSTRTVRPSEGMPAISDEIIRLEYDWSHEVCNGEKSNIVLIKEVRLADGTPSWAPDTDAITALLNKIENSVRTDSGTLRKLISNTPGWLAARETAIFARVKKVTDFINRPAEPGFGDLTDLAGWASLVDPTSMTDAFLEQINVPLPDHVTTRTQKRRLSQGARRKRNRKTRRIRKH